MANDFNIEFKGVNKLLDEFNVTKKELVPYSIKAMNTSLSRAVEKSKRLARVDTGYMRNNIQQDEVKEGHGVVTGRYVARADYSSYNEYGTYKMSAQPFMRPSVTAMTPFFYKAVKDALKKAAKFS